VSSSGHLALLPRLLGWDYPDLPADARKTFEVALHAGSAPALALALRGGIARDPHLQALTFLPPAAVGLALERPIERRLGGVRSVAIAQIVAGAALLAADLRPERRTEPTALDHLAVGLAQATALVPGVSRSGATISMALFLGYRRESAARFSFLLATPITFGAAVMKVPHLLVEADLVLVLVGMAAAAIVGFLSIRVLLAYVRMRDYRPFVYYRFAFAALVAAVVLVRGS
jgi:undecaprenyl-diphosphatase